MAIFLTVPIILYTQFREADEDKQALLLEGVNQQALLVTQAMRPLLEERAQPLSSDLMAAIGHLATEDTSIKVLFRPQGESHPDSFYYIAAAPEAPLLFLQGERDQLIELGVLDRLAETCEGALPVAIKFTNPEGQDQVITSLNPVLTDSGCWAIVIAHSTTAYQKMSFGRPYWETPEVRFAIIIYAGMALLVVTMFYGAWRGLHQLAALARSIRVSGGTGRSFAAEGNVLEVAGLAQELDRLVGALEDSSRSIRQAAEENAHAFKTPVAVIRQSLEPLKRVVADDSQRGSRALEVIEKSTERLDHLISCAWRMDEIAADLVDPPREEVLFSVLLERIMAGYTDLFRGRGITADVRVDKNVIVLADEDLLETVIENLVENALTFSPAEGTISVSLERQEDDAILIVADQGPGVEEEDLERIFERYYSQHPSEEEDGEPEPQTDSRHFGIGLWIVRRNIEAVGGTAQAENRSKGGLQVMVRLPLFA